jgi:hypothetical protein
VWAVYSLINEQIRIAWFKIGLEIWLRLWRKGRKKMLTIV